MKRNTKKTVPFVQQQLEAAIKQIKQGDIQGDVVQKLETILTQMQTLVTHDHLTGALNRVTLLEKLEAELDRSKRTGHTFTLAVFSIDGMPEILERHGQEITKQVIKIVTTEAIEVFRTLDSIGRIAAIEFAVVMPTTWLDQSLIAIKRLKERLDLYDWSLTAEGVKISVSTGLTPNAPGDLAENMLARACIALEKAKAKGANAVVEIDAEIPIDSGSE